MSELKLLALDNDDLAVISAHIQDSVFKLSDVQYEARRGQFALQFNRFLWEHSAKTSGQNARCRSFLCVKRVTAVRSTGINRRETDKVHSLLALRFTEKDGGPGGTLELILSGDGIIALDIECIETQLADVSGAWSTSSEPQHSAAF
jgi:hypothetical protein